MFIKVLVEYLPPSWDLTGDLFFIFTVPLAQLLTFAVTGSLAWYLLGLGYLPQTHNLLGILGYRSHSVFGIALNRR